MASMVRSHVNAGFRPKRILVLALLALCALGLTSAAWAKTFYVALNGSDSYDGLAPAFVSGTNGPFRTFQKAAYAVRAGDTVQIRGGTYYSYGGSWGYSYDGTEASPITVTAYPGETVIIDGNNHALPDESYTPLMQIYGDYYRVSNLEVRYGSYAGVNIIGNHCLVENVYAHHNDGSGIFTAGTYNTIKNCRAFNNSMENEYGALSVGWGFGISMCRNARYCKVSGCTSWNNWGEGISIASGYYCTIEDCVSYDNFSTNYYISQSVSGICQRNLSYYTPGNRIQPYVSSQNGIFAGDEGNPPDSKGNMIINNVVMGGDRCLLVAGDEAESLLIAYNTFANAFGRLGAYESGTVFFNSGASTGGRFVNNIVLQDDATTIGHLEATGLSFSYNNWSRQPASGCRGTGDVVGDPQVMRTGSTLAGELGPGWFRIQEGSAARDRAVVLSQVAEDFDRLARGAAPDMGAFSVTGGNSTLAATANGAPTSGAMPLPVAFSGTAAGGTAPYTYAWNFGDGQTSTSQNPSHTYTTAGLYVAALTVTDSTRTTAVSTLNVSVEATATILSAHVVASAVSGTAPLAVGFTGSASGGSSPYTYRWTFGDGETSVLQNPTHTYAAAGTYSAMLTVTDRTATTANWTVIIRASSGGSAVLSASGLATPSSGVGPLAVSFAATAAGGTAPYKYRWSFGDGGTSSLQNPSHTFVAPGSYLVILSVTDNRGARASTTMKIRVLTSKTLPQGSASRRSVQPWLILR
jgi:PKD repeat protein